MNDLILNYIREDGDKKIDKINDQIKIWPFSLTIKWAVWTPNSDENNVMNVLITWWEWVLWTIWTMVLYLMWIWVFRISIMAALRTSDITKAVVEPIYQFGNQVWQLVAKSPQYAPVFGGFSAQWLSKVSRMPQNALEQKVSNRVSPFQNKINEAFWVSTVDVNTVAKLRQKWWDKISQSELPEIQNELKGLIEKHWTSNKEVQKLIKEYAERLKESGLAIWTGVDENKIFDWQKLTDLWYWILHNKENMPASSVNTADAERYNSSHMTPNSSREEKKNEKVDIF